MIPDATRENMVEAMERFDRDLRESQEWANWEERDSHKFAIEHAGQKYPVKKLVSLATGTPVSSFSSGDEANSFVRKLGFQVSPLRSDVTEEASLQALFEQILTQYLPAKSGGGFGGGHPLWKTFTKLKNALEALPSLAQRRTMRVEWSIGKGNWAGVPWAAIIDSRQAEAPRRGIYVVFLFREDMTGVYATLNQGVTKLTEELGSAEARRRITEQAADIRKRIGDLGRHGFLLDDQIDMRSDGLGARYEPSTIAYKLYEVGKVPSDSDIASDVEGLVDIYSRILDSTSQPSNRATPPPFNRNTAIQELTQALESTGFVFEPWQVAAYVTALRTKPFVILAGVTGTGKSKLPTLVSRLTGGRSESIPVRPDWTDSADVLGYVDLQGVFRPGRLLQFARKAAEEPGFHWTCIVDEMNLARVEQYFAEVLSRIEDRHPTSGGGFVSRPLLGVQVRREDEPWGELGLLANLAIVGTVNMDETTHGFSRKVLDRAFTIELSDTDLSRWVTATASSEIAPWPVSAWHPRAISLGGLSGLSAVETDRIREIIQVLTLLNGFLQPAQLQVGYRTRDEVALFVLHAGEVIDAFLTREGVQVDPLDLAISMKILPRLVGGSAAVRKAVLQLLGWAKAGRAFAVEDEAHTVLEEWNDDGRPGAFKDAPYPRVAARLCMMWERLLSEGYTSYWL